MGARQAGLSPAVTGPGREGRTCDLERFLFGLRPKLNKVSQVLLEMVKPLNMVDQAAGRREATSYGAERGTLWIRDGEDPRPVPSESH